MAKILRVLDPFTAKTLQAGGRKQVQSGQVIGESKWKVRPPVKRVTSRASVRRLFVKDPYNLNSTSGIGATGRTVATFSPEADQFTNSPNMAFDPSKAPGAVSKVSAIPASIAANKPGKASRGHGNVVKRTLFNQNTGKRLKRL